MGPAGRPLLVDVVLAGACISVLANASHAVVAVDARVPSVLAALVAAIPPVVLVAITHLTVELTHPPAPVPAARAEGSYAGHARRPGRPARVNRVDQGGSVGEALRLRRANVDDEPRDRGAAGSASLHGGPLVGARSRPGASRAEEPWAERSVTS